MEKRKIGTGCLALLISFDALSQATQIEIPSSFNPVGSGARALGLGGSFIAMADDATSASWNPGALIQLRKPELALVWSDTRRVEDNQFTASSISDGSQSVQTSELNYLAASFPCAEKHCGKNMIFSVNYQRLFDLNRRWRFPLFSKSENGNFRTERVRDYDYVQEGALYALGVAAGIQITGRFSLGATLNFWDDILDENTWSQRYDFTSSGNQFITLPNGETIVVPTSGEVLREQHYSFRGTNLNLGMLWTPYWFNEQKLTVGAVYKTEFDADVNQIARTSGVSVVQNSVPDPSAEDRITPIDILRATRVKQTMPASVGVGVAWQWNDNFTTSFDLYRTFWRDFIITEQDGTQRSALSNRLIEEARAEDTTQIRLGFEYRIISEYKGKLFIVPIRGGFFRDPAPADNGKEAFRGLSVGTGITWTHWAFDIAWQRRWSEGDVGSSILQEFGFSQRVNEQTLYGSVVYRY